MTLTTRRGAARGRVTPARAGVLCALLGIASWGAHAQQEKMPTYPPPTGPAPTEAALDELVRYEAKLGPEDWRRARLAASSRRHEERALPGLGVIQRAFIAYPDTPDKVSVVVMLPEDQGLDLWARAMADEIAAMGYVVVVPDLLAGRAPNGGGTESFPDQRSVFRIHSQLVKGSEPQLTAQINFWADQARTLSQFNGKLAAVGFAWGAGRAAWFALQRHDLGALVMFYDAAPPPDALASLSVPLYGFYAAIDPRVTRSLDATRETLARLGKHYEPVVYPGSEHMFVRLGEEPRNTNAANIEARHLALARLQQILAAL